jgi:hypothetical protein
MHNKDLLLRCTSLSMARTVTAPVYRRHAWNRGTADTDLRWHELDGRSALDPFLPEALLVNGRVLLATNSP